MVDNLNMKFDGLTGRAGVDMPIRLNVKLVDNDGLEKASASFRKLPVGFTVTDGTNEQVVTSVDEVVSADGWNIDRLAIRPP